MRTPKRIALERLSRPELLELVKSFGLAGYSRYKKAELVDLLIAVTKGQPLAGVTRPKLPPEQTTQSVEDDAGKRTTQQFAQAQKAVPERPNGVAVQHPSASPEAVQYSGVPGPATDEDYGAPAVWPDRGKLPAKYGRDRLVVLTRDPKHLFCFWEISAKTLTRLSRAIPNELWEGRRMVLRVFADEPHERHLIQTIDVYGETGRNHFSIPRPGGIYSAEIGFFLPDGAYHPVLASGISLAPSDRPQASGAVRFMAVRPIRHADGGALESLLLTEPGAEFIAPEGIRERVESVVGARREDQGIGGEPGPSSPAHRDSTGREG